jgi:hypothetical protein
MTNMLSAPPPTRVNQVATSMPVHAGGPASHPQRRAQTRSEAVDTRPAQLGGVL